VIDPRAIVEPGARIAEEASIGPFSVIGPDVSIGRGTRIGPHVVITGHTDIGEDCRVYQFASLGEAPQDTGYRDEPTRLVIGDRNVIREYVTISRGTPRGGGVTRVGHDNLIMAYVHIAHDCEVGNHTTLANAASLAGHVQVQDRAILGGFTLVHQFCRIGAHAFTSMGAALNRDLPPYTLASGNYARAIGINKLGLHHAGEFCRIGPMRSPAWAALIFRPPLASKLRCIPADQPACIQASGWCAAATARPAWRPSKVWRRRCRRWHVLSSSSGRASAASCARGRSTAPRCSDSPEPGSGQRWGLPPAGSSRRALI
jgi:UDP-N-acetylglucosamine acyltransferase